jgi:hypothetical protein
MNIIFIFLLSLRAIFPPLIFSFLHPFLAILINECILDGMISPHHFFLQYIPDNIKGFHKINYDIFLDSWGFANGLLPVLYKYNKFYDVFENNRIFILTLFLWRIIGNIIVYKFKNYRFLLLFQNFYLPIYLAITCVDYFNLDKQRYLLKLMILFTILFFIREIYLVKINDKL